MGPTEMVFRFDNFIGNFALKKNFVQSEDCSQ